MTIKRWNGTTYVDLTTLKRWNGSAWVDITTAKRWTGTAWQDIPLPGGGGGGGALSVTAAPGNLSGFYLGVGISPLFVTIYSSTSVTVTPHFGTGPYTCVWTHESGQSALQVELPNSFTTRFVANVGRNREVGGTKRCTVTDALGATGYVVVGGILYYTT